MQDDNQCALYLTPCFLARDQFISLILTSPPQTFFYDVNDKYQEFLQAPLKEQGWPLSQDPHGDSTLVYYKFCSKHSGHC